MCSTSIQSTGTTFLECALSKYFDEFERVYPERYEEQPSVVRKIVDHCGLARDPPTPVAESTQDDLEAEFEELTVVPDR